MAVALGGKHFGVPLNAENEGMGGHIDRLDKTILGVCRHAESFAHVLDCLVVQGIDGYGRGTENVGGKRALQTGDGMRLGGVGLAVRLVGHPLRANILIQCTAACDVEHLDAATNGKQGLFALYCHGNEYHFKSVTQGNGLVAKDLLLLAVIRGMDIVSAREKNAVAQRQQLRDLRVVIGEGEEERNGTAPARRRQPV